MFKILYNIYNNLLHKHHNDILIRLPERIQYYINREENKIKYIMLDTLYKQSSKIDIILQLLENQDDEIIKLLFNKELDALIMVANLDVDILETFLDKPKLITKLIKSDQFNKK
jgi:hypothetical protein